MNAEIVVDTIFLFIWFWLGYGFRMVTGPRVEKPIGHVIRATFDPGTGHANDRKGWRCTCGEDGTTSDQAKSHFARVKELKDLNEQH